MKKYNVYKKCIAVIMALTIISALIPTITVLGTGTSGLSANETQTDKCLRDTESYLVLLSGKNDAAVGSVGGEWWVLSMARADLSPVPGFYCRYLKTAIKHISENINNNEQLHRAKSTENSRVILALVSMGIDPTDIGGHNLLQGLTSMKYVKKQGINGPIWALIALDSHNFVIPTAADASDQVTREALIEYVLSKQLVDGGWALSGTVADPDMTAMAMQSLAPYYNSDNSVKTAVDKAISCLSLLQKDNGGFASWGTVNSESCAQAVVALTALGINPSSDSRFIKNGYSVVDALCNFAVDGGGFKHIASGALNGMATEQAAYALVAFSRFKDGKTSLYNMSDITALKSDMHTWDNGVVNETATCKTSGKVLCTCVGCGATKEEAIPVTDNHIWNDGEIIKEATVNDEGVRKYTCTVCGKIKEESIAKLAPQEEKPSDNKPMIENGTKSPSTGDTADLTLPITIIILSSGIITVLMLGRKNHTILNEEANR